MSLDLHPLRTIAYRQIIELSHVINPQMPHWLGDPPTRYEPHAAIATDWVKEHEQSPDPFSGVVIVLLAVTTRFHRLRGVQILLELDGGFIHTESVALRGCSLVYKSSTTSI